MKFKLSLITIFFYSFIFSQSFSLKELTQISTLDLGYFTKTVLVKGFEFFKHNNEEVIFFYHNQDLISHSFFKIGYSTQNVNKYLALQEEIKSNKDYILISSKTIEKFNGILNTYESENFIINLSIINSSEVESSLYVIDIIPRKYK